MILYFILLVRKHPWECRQLIARSVAPLGVPRARSLVGKHPRECRQLIASVTCLVTPLRLLKKSCRQEGPLPTAAYATPRSELASWGGTGRDQKATGVQGTRRMWIGNGDAAAGPVRRERSKQKEKRERKPEGFYGEKGEKRKQEKYWGFRRLGILLSLMIGGGGILLGWRGIRVGEAGTPGPYTEGGASASGAGGGGERAWVEVGHGRWVKRW